MKWKVYTLMAATITCITYASPFKPQDNMQRLPPVSFQRPVYDDNYLRQVIKVMFFEINDDLGGTRGYRRNVRDMDLTMLLLGSYSGAWKSGAQRAAQALKREAEEELRKGRIPRRPDGRLLEGNTEDHSKSLGILYSASVSYGHIASPDERQSASLEPSRRPQYAFRLSQQALRNAVIKEHMDRLLELKQEIAFLRQQIDLYCVNQADDAIYLWGVKPQDFRPAGMPSRTSIGGCTACDIAQLLLEVQLAIRQGLAYISMQNSALGHRLCLLYMGQLTQTKALAQQVELKIADLAVQYAKLNNMEKDR